MEAEAALARLASRRAGLGQDEAASRLARDGPNELARSDRASPWRLFLRQYESPLVLILVFASIVALAVHELVEASIILAIIFGSTVLGFAQEYHASRALEALRRRTALKARVIRDGAESKIPASEIVTGDIVRLSAGDLAPADGVILDARDFMVSEAALTGEPFPVEKRPGVAPDGAPLSERTNCVFAGSSVRSGEATVLIAETGARTAFGEVAQRLRRREPETEFTRGLRHFGYLLLRVMVVLVVFVLIINQVLGRPFLESLLFSVALAVGMSPELLPAIVSVTLSAGARTMAKRGVLVRRLEAIENLGAIDVLCTDKTGTLTVGAAALESALDSEGGHSDRVMQLGFANASMETGIENVLDQAIVAAGEATGLACQWRKVDEIPYDFERKRLTIVADDGEADARLVITKGAFDQVIAVCAQVRTGHGLESLDDRVRAELTAKYRSFGEAGLRALAVATRRAPIKPDYTRADEQEMVFEGFLTFADPLKPDAKDAIAALAAAGVKVKLITGDNRFVAGHVAEAMGLNARAQLSGADIDALPDNALLPMAERTDIFVEVDPQQKERILRALQRNGHAVGFLGDGVNDAPALFAADVGVSVDQAVDVAREAADILLLERDLGVLRQGIEDGRKTFANTIKYISITTGSSFGNMVSMALAAGMLPFLPLTAVQVLLTNFLSDIPLLAVTTDSVDREHIERPQRWSVRDIQSFMLVFGILSSAFDLATFWLLLNVFHADQTTFRTTWFVVSVLTEICAVLILRTRRPVWRSAPGKIVAWLCVAVALIVIAAPFTGEAAAALGLDPLSPPIWIAAGLIVLAYAGTTEAAKIWYFRSRAPAGGGPTPPAPRASPVRSGAQPRLRQLMPMLFGLIVFAAVVAICINFSDLRQILRLVLQAQPAWLIPALAAQALTYVCAAAVWRRLLRSQGYRRSLRSLAPLSVAKLFTDQTVPPSGVSGALLVLRGLVRRGAPTRVAASAVLLAIVAYYAAFLLAVLLSLAMLVFHHDSGAWLTTAIVVATSLALAIPALIVLARTRGNQRVGNWARRIPGAAALLDKVLDAPLDFLRNPRLMAEAVGLHVAIIALDAATLWCALAAFSAEPAFWVAFVAYVMANVVATAAFVPMGLGTFEAGAVGTLTLLGVPLEAAFAAAMILRGLTFWLPMPPGLWFAQRELGGAPQRPAH